MGAFADAQRVQSPAACSRKSTWARSSLWTRVHPRAPPKVSGHVFFRDFSFRLKEENREGSICLGRKRYLPLWTGCCSGVICPLQYLKVLWSHLWCEGPAAAENDLDQACRRAAQTAKPNSKAWLAPAFQDDILNTSWTTMDWSPPGCGDIVHRFWHCGCPPPRQKQVTATYRTASATCQAASISTKAGSLRQDLITAVHQQEATRTHNFIPASYKAVGTC